MSADRKHTELWEDRPDGRSFLMNTIQGHESWSSISVPKRVREMGSDAIQQHVAESLKAGWETNGPYRGIYRYRIVPVLYRRVAA